VLADELIVSDILVEGADDIVTISPRVQLVVIVFVAIRLRIADKVEPVAGPTFAVVR
jgi:hypothetical protein